MYDLIIIGGGPAAISAGIYAARKQVNTLLIAKEWGGQMQWTNRIENYPGFSRISGQELVDKMVSHIEKFIGNSFETQIGAKVEKILSEDNNFIIQTSKKNYKSKAVIIATGRRPKKIGILGEEEFANKGVSYCPICDGPVFQGSEVAVIGGGNAGMESALDLVNYSPKVYLLEFEPELTGDKILSQEIKNHSQIQVLTNVEAKAIKGNDFVDSLVYRDRESQEEKSLDVKGVFIEIGSVPNSDLAKNMLELNKYGEIKIDKNNNTSQKGVFASGDCTDTKHKQIVVAVGEGAKASLEASRCLSKNN